MIGELSLTCAFSIFVRASNKDPGSTTYLQVKSEGHSAEKATSTSTLDLKDLLLVGFERIELRDGKSKRRFWVGQWNGM